MRQHERTYEKKFELEEQDSVGRELAEDISIARIFWSMVPAVFSDGNGASLGIPCYPGHFQAIQPPMTDARDREIDGLSRGNYGKMGLCYGTILCHCAI